MAGLTGAARALIAGAELVMGGERHVALARALIRGEAWPWPRPIGAAIALLEPWRGRPVVALASGDPFWYGVGTMLLRAVPADEVVVLPGPSALSLACARLGWAVQDTAVVSLCGRPLERLAPLLRSGRRILALSADATTPAAVAAYLCARGFGPSRLHVLEALGGPRERLRAAVAEAWDLGGIAALNLLAIEVAAGPDAVVLPLGGGLPDALFEHDGQLSKRGIRAITLSTLAPRGGELLWDVGCGSGSVGIEWLLRDPANRAIGIEIRADRAARAARNATALGVPHLEIVTGAAPAVLADLPAPDAVFVGGGVSAELLDVCWRALKPGGRIVVNGVTIETDALLIDALDRYGGTLDRITIARLDRIGGLRTLRPALPVTQWSATRP